jgi:regulator of replication initiation timing
MSPEQLAQMLKSNTTLNISPSQLENMLGNNATLSQYLNNISAQNSTLKMSPEQLAEMTGNSTTMNVTSAQLEKMLGKNATMDLTLDKLQEFLDSNSTGNFNSTISFTPGEMANLTSDFIKSQFSNGTQTNQTDLNTVILHVMCTVKTGDLSKLFENMAIPLSSCQIRE